METTGCTWHADAAPPSTSLATSDGQQATTHVIAQGSNQCGVAAAAAGIQFTVDPADDGTQIMPATIEVVFSYDQQVNFQVPPPSAGGGGSITSNVVINLPLGTDVGDSPDIPQLNFVHNSGSSSSSGTRKIIRQTTLAAGQTYIIRVGCNVEGDIYGGGTADAFADGKLVAIAITFEPLSVTINGPDDLLLYSPATTSPEDKLSASGTPLGGTYEYKVIQGTDKVELLAVGGSYGEIQNIKAKAPSKPPGNDVTVQVTYSFNGQSVADTHTLTVRKPTILHQVGNRIEVFPDKDSYCSVFDSYCFVYNFGIIDQLGKLIQRKGIPIVETNLKLDCPKGDRWDKEAWHEMLQKPGNYFTDQFGYFGDILSLRHRYYMIRIDKLNFKDWNTKLEGMVRQTATAGGWALIDGNRCQVYDHFSATSIPEVCPPCP